MARYTTAEPLATKRSACYAGRPNDRSSAHRARAFQHAMTSRIVPDQERNLRIALFHTTLPRPARKPAGVEVAVHRLANALVDLARDEVTVVSAVAPPHDARYAYQPFLRDARFIQENWIARSLLLPALLNFMDFSRFDVLHLHGDDWFYFLRPRTTLRTMHGSALREAQHASSKKHRAFMYGIYALEHLSARLCRLPIAVGRDTAMIYGLDEVVPLGVDESVFFPGTKRATPRILFVGTWAGRKRGQFAYEAFVRHVLPRFPDAELCMVSDYCPTHPRVVAEKLLDDVALAERFREAWVFALPSVYEGFGIPYLEALASGTPVVASPNSGAFDILDDGRAGILVEDDRFGPAVADLLEDEGRRLSLASIGIERARKYSWRAVALRHRELYLSVLSVP